MFKPFKNDYQSMQVGELIIENQTDKVIIYGDIDIYKNQAGLEQAKKMQNLFDDMVAELNATLHDITHDESLSADKSSISSSDSSNSKMDTNTQEHSIEEVKNPFS